MSDPKRLLDTECGRARELLHVGLSELAPAKVRSNVLSSVEGVVAALELDASGTELARPGGSDNSGGSDTLGGGAVPPKSALPAATDGVLTKLALFAKGSTALQLSATIAALGLGGLAYHELGPRNEDPVVATAAPRGAAPAPVEAQPSASMATAPNAPATAPSVPALPLGEGSASRDVPASRQVPESRELSPPPPVAKDGRPRGSRRVAVGEAVSRQEHEPADDLAGQLSLLQRARRLVASGEVESARELLDEYERRYPRGALRPEADVLRERSLRNPAR